MKLRALVESDIPTIVRLNDSASPAVPITSATEMAALLAVSGFSFAVIEDDLVEDATSGFAEPGEAAPAGAAPGQAILADAEPESATPIAFLIGMFPGASYESENYRYFEAGGSDSLYVDRIVVAESVRGSGIGRLLYEAVFMLAREQSRSEITCEVNLDPPNPESLAFHARFGFTRVGEQSTKGGAVTVALLAAPVGSA